jgi:hypothetical protein
VLARLAAATGPALENLQRLTSGRAVSSDAGSSF